MRHEIIPIEWPAWRYGPNDQSGVFNNPSEVPMGWSKYPNTDNFKASENECFDTESLRKQCEDQGIEINPQWPDKHMAILLGLVQPEV